MTNEIPAEQATPALITLSRARQNTYKGAKWVLGTFVVLSILLPVASALLAKWDDAKPWLALGGLVLLIVDVAWLQTMQKDRIKRGAKLAEEFDTKLFKLQWNRFVAGDPVLPEDIRKASKRLLSAKREKQIATWYESAVNEVPLHLGRLICQRTNIEYDRRLRRQYGGWLLSVVAAAGAVIFAIAFVKDSKISELVLSFAVPFTPVLAWALRENRKQVDTATSLERLRGEVANIWREALDGAAVQELEKRSRQLQDAIYQHRASAPLVFNWAYNLMRDRNEDEAKHAVRTLVDEAKVALSKTP